MGCLVTEPNVGAVCGSGADLRAILAFAFASGVESETATGSTWAHSLPRNPWPLARQLSPGVRRGRATTSYRIPNQYETAVAPAISRGNGSSGITEATVLLSDWRRP
jgi:hypothetical protein